MPGPESGQPVPTLGENPSLGAELRAKAATPELVTSQDIVPEQGAQIGEVGLSTLVSRDAAPQVPSALPLPEGPRPPLKEDYGDGSKQRGIDAAAAQARARTPDDSVDRLHALQR